MIIKKILEDNKQELIDFKKHINKYRTWDIISYKEKLLYRNDYVLEYMKDLVKNNKKTKEEAFIFIKYLNKGNSILNAYVDSRYFSKIIDSDVLEKIITIENTSIHSDISSDFFKDYRMLMKASVEKVFASKFSNKTNKSEIIANINNDLSLKIAISKIKSGNIKITAKSIKDLYMNVSDNKFYQYIPAIAQEMKSIPQALLSTRYRKMTINRHILILEYLPLNFTNIIDIDENSDENIIPYIRIGEIMNNDFIMSHELNSREEKNILIFGHKTSWNIGKRHILATLISITNAKNTVKSKPILLKKIETLEKEILLKIEKKNELKQLLSEMLKVL